MRLLVSSLGGRLVMCSSAIACACGFEVERLFSQSDALATLLGAFIGLIIGALLAPHVRHQSEQRWVTPYGTVMSILIFLVWMIPMALTGMMNTSLLDIPAGIRNQYRISCLFTHSSKTWQTVHYEVRQEGQVNWIEGPLEGFFDIDIFGHRTRFNPDMLASKGNDRKSRLRRKRGGVIHCGAVARGLSRQPTHQRNSNDPSLQSGG